MNALRIVFYCSLLTPLAFAAVPNTMLFQGSLAQNGVPLDGLHAMTIKLCPSPTVNVSLGCNTLFNGTATFTKGYYSVILGALPSFNQQWYLDLAVDNVQQESRVALTSAPSAIYADSANVAVQLAGDPVLRYKTASKIIELPNNDVSMISRSAPATDPNRIESFIHFDVSGATPKLTLGVAKYVQGSAPVLNSIDIGLDEVLTSGSFSVTKNALMMNKQIVF